MKIREQSNHSNTGHALLPDNGDGSENQHHGDIVFPPDERVQITNTTGFPWNAFGWLIMTFPNGETYTGTATLIDDRHVLTAAHNVFGNDIGGYASRVTFIPAANGKAMPYGYVKGSRIFITEDYRFLSPPNPNETRSGNVDDYTQYTEDYAIIRLEQRLPLPIFGLYAASNAQLATKARITGYPGDKPKGTMWSGAGDLAPADAEFLFYQIDTYKGESGSAILVDLGMPIGLTVVGIHVAGDRDLETNFGVRLDGPRIKQILEWINSSDKVEEST